MKFFFAITYPTTLDNLPNPTPTDLLENATLGLDHDQQHANANDAIEALEAKVGANSSGVTTSHDYKLSAVTGAAKALTSGTSTQSVTGLTLTTPVINVGSDATGDIYYRSSGGLFVRLGIGSTDNILSVVAGLPAWIANPAASNATSTVKGVVEMATAAEITAGTSTGGTGALLAVGPDQLLIATPALNASSFTNVPHRLQTVTTDITISSSTVETTIITQSIAGGTLSTANYLRAVLYISNIKTTNTGFTCTFKTKYGATTLITDASFNGGGAAGAVWSGRLEIILAASGATGTQNAVMTYSLSPFYTGNGNVVSALFSTTVQGTSTEDSTAAKTFAVTAQMSNSSANDTLTVALVTLESVA